MLVHIIAKWLLAITSMLFFLVAGKEIGDNRVFTFFFFAGILSLTVSELM